MRPAFLQFSVHTYRKFGHEYTTIVAFETLYILVNRHASSMDHNLFQTYLVLLAFTLPLELLHLAPSVELSSQ